MILAFSAGSKNRVGVEFVYGSLMTLSSPLISESPAYGDLRREVRTPATDFVLIRAKGREEPAPGMLTDISASGLGLVLSVALERECRFSVTLADVTGAAARSSGPAYAGRLYRVVHCRRIHGGLYSIGAIEA